MIRERLLRPQKQTRRPGTRARAAGLGHGEKLYEINRNHQLDSNSPAIGIWRAGFRPPGPAGETKAAGTTGQANEARTPAKTATAAAPSAAAKATAGTKTTAATRAAASQEPAGSTAEATEPGPGELQQATATTRTATGQKPTGSTAETTTAAS